MYLEPEVVESSWCTLSTCEHS